MKQLIKSIIVSAAVAIIPVLALATVGAESVHAIDPGAAAGRGLNSAGGGGTGPRALEGSIEDVVNVLLFVLGAVAVIMIVIGGIRYTLSNGDSSQITAAKNTVLYAVIGLIVALLAYAIVNFVIRQF